MNVVVRTDASIGIGTGHARRCLALADTLRHNGAAVRFICRLQFPDLSDLISENDFPVEILTGTNTPHDPDSGASDSQSLETDWRRDAQETVEVIDALGNKPDWLIVDHYGIDWHWEGYLRAAVDRILVIDDLANRKHDCDLLLDQNTHPNASSRYDGLLPRGGHLLAGPRYALLRSEFRLARESAEARTGPVRNILVFFGGVDASNLTKVAIEALVSLDLHGISVDVVIGGRHPERQEIESACNRHGFQCHVQTSSMSDLMRKADLAIGAGGSATWERCCVGLPCLTFASAENQRMLMHNAALSGFLYSPEVSSDASDGIARHLQALLENPLLREVMSRSSMDAVDGYGTDRVARAMGVSKLFVREAIETDSKRVFGWRNQPVVRRASRNDKPLDWDTHDAWFHSVLSDNNRPLLVGESSGNPVGVVRFDIVDAAAELSIYMAPRQSQRGLGSDLLLAAEEWLKSHRPDVLRVHAEVREDNVPSHRLFAASGYQIETTRYMKRLHDD